MSLSIDFDYDKFGNDLLQATRISVTNVQKTHPNHNFYSYALYTSGEQGYLILTVNSEQGLTQIAEKYLHYENYRDLDISLADMRIYLRHSPTDSPLHALNICIKPFKEINQKLEVRLEQMLTIYRDYLDEPEVTQFSELHRGKFNQICFQTLQKLAGEGIFGTNSSENGLVLNLLMGDQSDQERLQYASQINSPEIVAQYETEVKRGHEITRSIHQQWGWDD